MVCSFRLHAFYALVYVLGDSGRKAWEVLLFSALLYCFGYPRVFVIHPMVGFNGWDVLAKAPVGI